MNPRNKIKSFISQGSHGEASSEVKKFKNISEMVQEKQETANVASNSAISTSVTSVINSILHSNNFGDDQFSKQTSKIVDHQDQENHISPDEDSILK